MEEDRRIGMVIATNLRDAGHGLLSKAGRGTNISGSISTVGRSANIRYLLEDYTIRDNVLSRVYGWIGKFNNS